METSILERVRLLEADIEAYTDAVVQQLLLKDDITNQRHRLLIDHFVATKLEEISRCADRLADLYLDEDEIVEAREAPSEGSEVLAQALRRFEASVADIRESRSAVLRSLPPVKRSLAVPDPKALDALFSPAELYGRCLYMQTPFQRYAAFMGVTMNRSQSIKEGWLADQLPSWSSTWEQPLSYTEFMSKLPALIGKDMPSQQKLFGFSEYRVVIQEVRDYLTNFYLRIRPLEKESLQRLEDDVTLKGEAYWEAMKSTDDIPFVSAVPSTHTLHAKKCSGLLVPSSLRHHTEGFSLWPLPFLKGVLEKKESGEIDAEKDKALRDFPQDLEEVKAVCVSEGMIIALLKSLLFDVYQQTNSHLIRSSSRTMEEVEEERRNDDEQYAESLTSVASRTRGSVEGTVAQAAQYHLQAMRDTEAASRASAITEELPANSLLGDDGKPIARWLAQLQQLDKKYVCDVCGGAVYPGPKLFREHFGVDRHIEGLRRLGITEYLKYYEGITSTREAIEMRNALQNSMIGTRKRLRIDADVEELQDHTGKVVTVGAYAQYHGRRA